MLLPKIREWLGAAPTARKILFWDGCRTGGKRAGPRPGTDRVTMENLLQMDNTFIAYATPPEFVASEYPRGTEGACRGDWSYYPEQALSQYPDGVRIEDLAVDTRKMMSEENIPQKPWGESNLPIKVEI